MTQGVLPFKFEQENSKTGLTGLAGGDCVDDIRILEGDEGFCKLLKKSEMHGLKAKTRKAYAALA